MRREYYLHKRNSGIFYVEFINPENGKKLSARSTGETVRSKAEAKAEFWKLNGIPTGKTKNPRPIEEAAGIEAIIRLIRKSDLNADDALRVVTTLKSLGLIDITAVKNTGLGVIPFAQFLEKFWDYDKSEYIQDKLAHGQSFHRSHAQKCLYRVKSALIPFFGDKKLNCITTDDLRNLTRQLADRGLATSTINQITLCARTSLKWAFEQKIIPENPCIGLRKYSVVNKERGVFTETEATAVFAVDWKDLRAFAASLVAATTGARHGEVLALRQSDIGETTLNIAHNYSQLDGLKLPKNGKPRYAPLLPQVRAVLLDLMHDNPHTDVSDPYIFYSLKPDRPVGERMVLKGLREAIETVNEQYKAAAIQAKLDKPEIAIDWKARNIDFHSWRHWFISKITEIIDGEKVAKVSGHLTEAVFKKYADHIEAKNVHEVGEAAAQAFGNVLQFKKAA